MEGIHEILNAIIRRVRGLCVSSASYEMEGNGIIAILLAAGKSRRMKVHKLALPLCGTTIGNSALQNALNSVLDQIFVVTREEDPLKWIDSKLFHAPLRNKWTPLACRDCDMGQAHSLRCGLLAAIDRKPKGIMVLLADQPFVSENLINDLVRTYEKLQSEKNTLFLAARFQGIPRPPIIFSPEAYPELLQLEGDEGARSLLKKQKLAGAFKDYANAGAFLDIDTMEDYEKWKGVRAIFD